MLEACGLRGHRIGGAQISPQARELHRERRRGPGDRRARADGRSAPAGARGVRRRARARGAPSRAARAATGRRNAVGLPARAPKWAGCLRLASPRRAPPSSRSRAGRRRSRCPLSRILPSGRSLLVGFAIVATCRRRVRRRPRDVDVRRRRDRGHRGAPLGRSRAWKPRSRRSHGTSLLSLDAAAIDRRLERFPSESRLVRPRLSAHGEDRRLGGAPRRRAAQGRAGLARHRARARPRAARGLHPAGRCLGSGSRTRQSPGTETSLDAEEGSRLRSLLGSVLSADRRFFAAGRGGARSGEGERVLVLRAGTEIRLGAADDLPLQLAVAERVLDQVGPGARYVDVSVPERAVVG